MANHHDNNQQNELNVTSQPTIMPPAYANPSQYPSTSGIQYPQQYPSSNPATGYPPTGVQPGAQPYYAPPVLVYTGQPAPNYAGQQGPQQVVITNNLPLGLGGVFYGVASRNSMIGAIALSCIVFWFCGFLFGGIAFILAMVGQSSAAAGDDRTALRMRNASYSLSIVGIIIAIIVIAVVSTSVRRSYYSYCYTYYPYGSSSYYYCK